MRINYALAGADKFILYRSLPTLREYVLIDPAQRQLEVFTLAAAGASLLTAYPSALQRCFVVLCASTRRGPAGQRQAQRGQQGRTSIVVNSLFVEQPQGAAGGKST